METAEIRELISAFVPEEILRDFELREVKKECGVYRLYMDEKDYESHYPPELTEAKEVVRCGYMNPCEILTFPIASCETGQSEITDAYRLPCKKVIHTVGPVWHGGSKGEGRLLASCYDTALELANANRLHRIAFPCISTGVYRFPKAEAARIALHSIFAFIRKNTESTKIDCAYEITIVCFCEEDVQFYRDCFWAESLTLFGKRDEVKAFKDSIDMLDEAYWKALFSSVPELEENHSKTIILLSVKCGVGNWGDRFVESIAKHVDEINDFYALCAMACLWMYRQYVDWSEPGFDHNTAMTIIKALQEAKDQSFKIYRIVQILHRWGYENVRLSPQTSNLGNLYYRVC